MNVVATTALVLRRGGRALRNLGLLLALFVAGVSLGAHASGVLGEGDATPAACAVEAQAFGAAAFARTELFFGRAIPDGGTVTEEQWRNFLDTEVTPRFPEGFTVLTGTGQWQEEDKDIVQEQSMIVILLYPAEMAADAGAKIDEIRAAYVQTFQQDSVLRADDAAEDPTCVGF